MEYHKDRFDDFSVLIFKGEKLIAVLPANKVGDTLHSHQGLTYGGMVTHKALKFNEVLEVFKLLLQFLEDHNILYLNIKSLPSIYASGPDSQLAYLMFLLNASVVRRDALSVIDYNFMPESISSNRKRGFKKGQSHNLVVKEESSLENFWTAILIPNLKAQHNVKPVHTLEEMTLLQSHFPNNIRQFNVYKGDTIVAGTTIFETKNVAHAQYISANSDKQELGSLDVLFQYLIHTVFKDKLFFDFGTSNVNNGLNINKGLLYWKESFGARMIVQDFYSVSTKNHELLNSVFI
ncbi:GNAT family N-acetyltransferase [Olleya sp. UBA1516]|uniref:GNAT family N-acetyltransferase n=1 Tax=Olleya sp. UBA1516 TaxID=1947013 RepID=UPI0025CBEBAA|nr:GNAT family N-acetyltransferase [Olleya sp. UBA1516]|tara:strand:+ start:3463 stop:4338 length:876 start_codon:yes stop_codon:yes gene_type:complete